MDIISLPVEYHDSDIDGKFRLVAIASQRAKELSMGAKPKVETKTRKVTSISIEEAISGKLDFVTGEEAIAAREAASTFDYRKMVEERRRLAAGEDLTELEKDLKVYLHERETLDKKAFDELFGEKKEEESEEPEETEE